MAYRRFEMFEIRQMIQRLRLGESVRHIARSQRFGRATVALIHTIAGEQGWLDPLVPMPDDATLALWFKTPRKTPQNVSSVESYRDEILTWQAQGIDATTMRRALHQNMAIPAACMRSIAFRSTKFRRQPKPRSSSISRSLKWSGQPRYRGRSSPTARRVESEAWIFVCTLPGAVTDMPRLSVTSPSRRGCLAIVMPSSGSMVSQEYSH